MSKRNAAASLIPISYIGDGYIVRADNIPVLVWEIDEGINLFVKSSEEVSQTIATYRRLFESLGHDDQLQIIASFRPLDANEVFDKYGKDASPSSGIAYEKLLPTQREWLNKVSETCNTGRIKYYVLYSLGNTGKKDVGEILGVIKNKSLSILSYLSRLGLSARQCSKIEIKNLLDREINPFLPKLTDKAFNMASGSNGGDGFASQKEVLSRDAVIPHKDHLEFGCGFVAKTFYLESLPFDRIEPFVRNIFTQCGYFRLSIFAYGVDQQFAYKKFERQFVQSGQKMHMDKNYDAQSTAIEDSTKVLIDRYARGELAFNRFSFYCTMYAENIEELNMRASVFEGICADYPIQRGYREQDKYYQSSLPCCYNATPWARYYTTSDGLANAFPFISARVGMKTGAVIGFDALGEPVHFNQWARDEIENPVHVVLGQMGKGKSFMQELIEIRQSPMDVVSLIFHKSNNYDFSTKLLGGQVFDFHLDSDTKLNIFDPYDESELINGPNPETVELIKGFLNIIFTDAGKAGIDKKYEGILDTAIRDTYLGMKGKVPILEDLGNTIKEYLGDKSRAEHKELLSEILLKMQPYIGKGSYARLTNVRSSINIKSNRIALNLSKISESNINLFALSMFVASSILGKALAANKGKKYVKVKFDETWAFLKTAAGDALINNLNLRARHLNIALDVVTQFASHLLETQSAKSVLQGANCVTLLQQPHKDFPVLKDIFGFNEAELGIIGGLNQVKGVYSEAYMITGNKRGLVRIVPDVYTYWIATSESTHDLPKRNQCIEKHTENGNCDYWEVVKELINS